MKWRVLFLTGACVAILLQGCVGGSHWYVSKPTIAPGGNWKTTDTVLGGGTLKGPGLELTLIPHNYRPTVAYFLLPVPLVVPWTAPDEAKAPFFVIGFFWEPESESFSFNPGRVTLQIGEAKSLGPKGFRGPFKTAYSNTGPSCCYRHERAGCPADDVGFVTSASGSIPVTRWSCFELMFDILPPPPEQEFALSIDGLEKGEKPLPVPLIHFKEGSALGGW